MEVNIMDSKPELPIIDVDANGTDAEGEDNYGWRAHKKHVKAGLMINKPVMLRFPDGRVVKSNQVLITPKGLTFFAKQFSERGTLQ